MSEVPLWGPVTPTYQVEGGVVSGDAVPCRMAGVITST